jgi:hypothetical protein
VYQQGNEQLLWNAKRIAQLQNLRCIAQLSGGPPQEFVVPLLPDVCDPEMTSQEFERCLLSIYTKPIYKEPRELTVVDPTPPAPPKPKAPKPPKTPRPAGRSGAKK